MWEAELSVMRVHTLCIALKSLIKLSAVHSAFGKMSNTVVKWTSLLDSSRYSQMG